MANERFTVAGTNIQEKASMIWNVADLLRGSFKPHEYGLGLENGKKIRTERARNK